MIHLKLQRKPTTPSFTEGDLYVNGEWFAVTLEDTVRKGKKVYGETAIPAGKYRIEVNFSAKFKKKMVQILNVPGFDGVRLHQGATAVNSLGCILISKRRGGTPGTLALMAKGSLTDTLTALVESAGGGTIEIIDG